MEVLRGYRITLDPRPDTKETLLSHAGASRWAFNLALGAKIVARRVWEQRVQNLVDAGADLPIARAATKVKVPSAALIDKARVRVRGTDRAGNPVSPDWIGARNVLTDAGIDPEVAALILTDWFDRCADPAAGIQPWAPSVPNSVIQRGQKDADTAWSNWMKSFKGARAGRRVGFPRFKARGRARDSFYLVNTECRLVANSYRRLRLGGVLGEVRTCDTTKRIARALAKRQGVIQSVTVSRGAHRWYASVLVKEEVPDPKPTRRQVATGGVGVSVGAEDHKVITVDSTGRCEIENPQVGLRAEAAIVKAQRKLSRAGWIPLEGGGRKASRRRVKARERLARLHHEVAVRRATHTHLITKWLASTFSEVCIEDLDVLSLTATARGRRGRPGRKVKAKATANRRVLDVEPGELRRQLTYKAAWSGATLATADVVERSTCEVHGGAKAKAAADFTCTCGLVASLDAARVLAVKAGAVASGRGETLNARGAVAVLRGSGGCDPGRPSDGSPPDSDVRASP